MDNWVDGMCQQTYSPTPGLSYCLLTSVTGSDLPLLWGKGKSDELDKGLKCRIPSLQTANIEVHLYLTPAQKNLGREGGLEYIKFFYSCPVQDCLAREASGKLKLCLLTFSQITTKH